jgi:enamine deaminase RidA (YjgF/YER057c/UK114 family)
VLAALAAVGGQYHDVVKFDNYLVDMKYLPIFPQVRDSYLADESRPASTTVAISGLARAGAFLEIEAVAVLPAIARKRAAGNVRSRRAATKTARRKGK